MGAVVGIDLGTTNTVIAAAKEGRAVALQDESGSTSIPSIVSFLPSGAVMVGNAAKERRAQDPRNTIYSVKRLIGRTWDSSEVKTASSRLPFELREGPGRATFVVARGETYTLPEISAFVLRKARSIAELALGEPVDRAVITVPANFNDLQRAATKVAGRVAGLEVLRILNEPTAAALAFGHTRGNREIIAVYDFGGGTFDLTLLRLTDDVFEVLATAGDTFLGGDDIDAAIAQGIQRFLGRESPAAHSAEPNVLERLRAAAEHIKLTLSESTEARIRLSEHELAAHGALEFAMSRDEFNELVDPIVARTFKVCADALGMARLTPKDLDHILLVGGTTRIPLVRKRVEEYFGKRARDDLDPHEVVALGAAQQAMALTQLRANAAAAPAVPAPSAASNQDVITKKNVVSPHLRQQVVSTLTRQQTDAGVGSGGDAVEPGRVSVVSPSGPLTSPIATTKDFGKAARSPQEPTTATSAALQPVAASGMNLEPLQPPSTLDGLGPTFGSSRAAGTPTKTVPMARQNATASPSRGQGPARSPEPRPDLLPLSMRETLPDDSAAWDEQSLDAGVSFGLPIVVGQPHPAERMATTQVSATFGDERSGGDKAPITDLPLVLARAPQKAAGSTAQPRLGLPAPNLSSATDDGLTRDPLPLDEYGFEEPTAVRPPGPGRHKTHGLGPEPLRSAADDLPDLAPRDKSGKAAEFLPREPNDLPLAASPHPAPRAPAAEHPTANPAALDEEEIRARYGDLPLIVGGKRVGARTTDLGLDAGARSDLRQKMPTVPDGDPPPPTLAGLPAVQSPPVLLPLPALRAATPAMADTSQLAPSTVDSAIAAGESHRRTKEPSVDNPPMSFGTAVKRPPPPSSAIAPIPARENDQSASLETNLEPAARTHSGGRPRPPSALETPSRESSDSVEPVPRSYRAPPTREAARQRAADEHSLPIPDLPPPSPARPTAPVQLPSPLEKRTSAQEPPPPHRPIPPAPQMAEQHSPTVPVLRSGVTSPMISNVPTGQVDPRNAAPLPGPIGHTPDAAAAAPPRPPAPAPHPSAPVATRGTQVPSLFSSLPKTLSGRPALLIDVTPLSLCVETVGGYVDVLVARNTPVPCERTREFITAQDNQQSVIVRVAQGESRLFRENAPLGEVHLTGIPAAPRGQARIAVTFGIDADGLLHVRALDVPSGQSAQIDLRLSGMPASPEVTSMMLRHAAKDSA
jgi:molecular chaperone DnaK (HSP70)